MSLGVLSNVVSLDVYCPVSIIVCLWETYGKFNLADAVILSHTAVEALGSVGPEQMFAESLLHEYLQIYFSQFIFFLSLFSLNRSFTSAYS